MPGYERGRTCWSGTITGYRGSTDFALIRVLELARAQPLAGYHPAAPCFCLRLADMAISQIFPTSLQHLHPSHVHKTKDGLFRAAARHRRRSRMVKSYAPQDLSPSCVAKADTTILAFSWSLPDVQAAYRIELTLTGPSTHCFDGQQIHLATFARCAVVRLWRQLKTFHPTLLRRLLHSHQASLCCCLRSTSWLGDTSPASVHIPMQLQQRGLRILNCPGVGNFAILNMWDALRKKLQWPS